MCGIVGMFSADAPISQDALSLATEKLYHRGPDGRKTWVSPDGRVGLGHARLSIIDLAGGTQPLSNEDNSIHVVVNGEFYDFERIQNQLRQAGHKLKTGSDSEILVHLYEDYGLKCLQQLRGEYAFILWDERNKTLIAGRDRFGIKPLFYSQIGSKIYFASEVKALFAAGVPPKWDQEGFYQSVAAQASPDRTMFNQVYQVMPGEYLVVKNGHARHGIYWDFKYPKTEQLEKRSDEDWIAELRERLNEAVKIRMRADVPVGMYLSGGIDSSAILGMAVQHTSQLNAYSIRFPEDANHSEEAVASESANKLGAKVHFLTVTSDLVADNFAKAVTLWEELPRVEWIVGKFLLSKLVRDNGTRVVLTGEGADEIFGGYGMLVRDMILQDPGSLSRDAAKQLLSELPAHVKSLEEGHLESVKKIFGYVPTLMTMALRNGNTLRPFFKKGFESEFARNEPFLTLLDYFDYPGKLEGREPLAKSMYHWAKTIMPNFFLAQCGDRSEMAHSIEGRVPFLDHMVVETAMRMPASLKIRETSEKFVLREAVRPYVSETVFKARKKAFVTQHSRIAQPKSRLNSLLQDTVRSQSFASNPFFDQKAIVGLMDRINDKPVEITAQLSTALLTILGSAILQDAYKL